MWGIKNLWDVVGSLGMVLPLIVILLLPGTLLLRWMGLRDHFDLGEQITLSVGLSLAILPLVMLWTSILNLAWIQTGVLVAGIALLLLGGLELLRHPPASILHPPTSNLQPLALLTIFLLSLAARLSMVRDLAAPAWVDSVHHGLITRLIMEHGGFPNSFAPHFPPEVSHYNLGYHSVLAAFIWMTNLDLPKAMLILGQVLNALTIFAAYTLTITLAEDCQPRVKKNAALLAALITGIFTPMPAYYTSWGRYTQLTGLLILPAGLVFAKLARTPSPPAPLPQGEGSRSLSLWERVGARTTIAKLIPLSTLTFGGLFLVHYRTTAFLGVLLFTYILVEIFLPHQQGKTRLATLKNFAVTLLPATLLAVALTAPWLFPTLAGLIVPKSQAWSGGTTPLFSDFNLRYLTAGLGTPTLVLAGAGLILAALRKKRFALTLTLWVTLLFALANLGALGLPGSGFINNTSVEIALFLPISLLGGYFISESVHFLLAKARGWGELAVRWGLVLLLVGLTIFGVREILTILNPETVFFHAADREALAWIEKHIPREETILINPTGWGYGLYRGEDGGAWIPPLTGNPTIPPPVLYGLGDEKRIYVNQFVTAVQTTAQNPGELAQVLNGYEVKYIYLGRKGGILSPTLLGESEYFAEIYEGEGTWVFQVMGVP